MYSAAQAQAAFLWMCVAEMLRVATATLLFAFIKRSITDSNFHASVMLLQTF